jgi:hypothetical protein
MTRHLSLLIAYVGAITLSIIVHVIWLRGTHNPVIGQRFGASLIVTGILITAHPVLRSGFRKAVDRQLSSTSIPQRQPPNAAKKQAALLQDARPEVVNDVIFERVVGVGVIITGTLLNGYGDLLLKLMGSG